MIAIASSCQQGSFTLDVALQLHDGITGLFGASGAGKSTLLRTISGLSPCPSRLSIGTEVLDSIPVHQRRVGLVFQNDLLFPHMNVEANLLYGIGGKQPSASEPLINRIITGLGLKSLLHRRPASLSGGERQRVAMGRSLLPLPRLLLGDEPLSSLDQATKRTILPFLRDLCIDLRLPMIYVSHDLGELLSLTDRLAVLDHGRVVGHGTFDELRADDRVRPLLYDETVVRRLINH